MRLTIIQSEIEFGPSGVGKRNELFVAHPEAGEGSAVIYTLLGSCRRHGIKPFEYLKDLLTRLPAAKIAQINEFTPVPWAKQGQSEEAKGRLGRFTSRRPNKRMRERWQSRTFERAHGT